jgi:hypothetical protein
MAATAAIAAGCLGSAAHADPVRPGEQNGLGLTGPAIPDILQKAKADTYAPPAEPICQSLPAEIDALNEVLGPDADQAKLKTSTTTRATRWMGGAVRGLIPHRDVIRFLTGAGKKDDRLKDAAMAGWARRGYLKGLAKTLDCTSGTSVAALDAARPAATIAARPLPPLPEAAGDARAIPVSDTPPAPEIAPAPLEIPPIL